MATIPAASSAQLAMHAPNAAPPASVNGSAGGSSNPSRRRKRLRCQLRHHPLQLRDEPVHHLHGHRLPAVGIHFRQRLGHVNPAGQVKSVGDIAGRLVILVGECYPSAERALARFAKGSGTSELPAVGNNYPRIAARRQLSPPYQGYRRVSTRNRLTQSFRGLTNDNLGRLPAVSVKSRFQ